AAVVIAARTASRRARTARDVEAIAGAGAIRSRECDRRKAGDRVPCTGVNHTTARRADDRYEVRMVEAGSRLKAPTKRVGYSVGCGSEVAHLFQRTVQPRTATSCGNVRTYAVSAAAVVVCPRRVIAIPTRVVGCGKRHVDWGIRATTRTITGKAAA